MIRYTSPRHRMRSRTDQSIADRRGNYVVQNGPDAATCDSPELPGCAWKPERVLPGGAGVVPARCAHDALWFMYAEG
eukprot:28745-Pelagococcus_subviridis.AAC.1